jgi:hypothetical protein
MLCGAGTRRVAEIGDVHDGDEALRLQDLKDTGFGGGVLMEEIPIVPKSINIVS